MTACCIVPSPLPEVSPRCSQSSSSSSPLTHHVLEEVGDCDDKDEGGTHHTPRLGVSTTETRISVMEMDEDAPSGVRRKSPLTLPPEVSQALDHTELSEVALS